MKKYILIALSLVAISASAQTQTNILPTGDTLKFYPKKTVVEPPVVVPPVIIIKTVEMGPEQLAAGLTNLSNTIILLKPGIYTETYYFKNLSNVVIDGGSEVIISTDKVRAIQLEGNIKNFTLKNIAFKNCSLNDYVICEAGFKNTVYNPADPTTYWENINLVNITSDNSSTLFHADGSITSDGKGHTGVIKDFLMLNCKVINSPNTGMVVYLGNALAYAILNNTIDNINTLNNNHNGIFMLCGNGVFTSNRVTNHQGNALRAWCFAHSGSETVDVSNNTILGSRKYSAFEFQAQKENLGAVPSKPANVNVYNNTAGNLNTLNDWNGVMIDVYNLSGGKITYSNNLGFNMKRNDGRPIDDMQNVQFGTPVTSSGNKYYTKQADAVDANLKSKIAGVGAQ